MTAFLLIVMLFGAGLGQRFKVFILVPVIGLLTLALIVCAPLLAMKATEVASLAGLAAAALQFGYLGGAVLRLTLAASRAPHLSKLRANGTLAPRS